MKHVYRTIFSLAILFSFSHLSVCQVTYVNHNASGANNGSSWDDALTNLQNALNIATEGEIWIAAGTYYPTYTELDTFNTFTVSRAISIYGGFAGTETTKDDRIEGENTTILSGDLLADDIDNNFSTNKADNVFHVMTIDAPVPSTIVLDALTISGGNTRESSPNDDYSWRGGGIYSYNTIEMTNCTFTNNFARSGAGIYLSPENGGGNGSTIDNCHFTKNSTVSQAAGIFVNTVNDVSITNSIFENNTTNRGTVYPIFCQNFTVSDCVFRDNISSASGNFGGAMFIWSSNGIVENCIFERNNTGNGAGIYIDGREQLIQSADNFIFENCEFTNNAAIDFGGGCLRSFSASYTVKDCSFTNNSAPNGGAIFSSGDGQEIVHLNNTFSGNTADFGGCQASYGTSSNYHFTNNYYEGNAALTSGGALINGFGSNVTIDDSEFLSNIAGFGGAIFNQNDTTTVTVNNSTFMENAVTDGSGGAINISGPVVLTVDNSLFESNSAGFGGAINGSEGIVDVVEGKVTISNSIINLNTVSNQGAGISLVDLDLDMTNTVVSTNFNTGTGAGGGLSLNTTANKSATFNITNSTIADNFAIIGGGIGAFSEDETSECIINLQNTIFANEGLNYDVEAGNPIVNSLGGNISTDATLNDILNGPGDINESGNIMFLDGANYDFRLTEGSPAIDIGVADGAPETDILGNSRVGAPDAGAYEYQSMTSIEEIQETDQLWMVPNPVLTYTTVSFENNWTGQIVISIMDMSGKMIERLEAQKTAQMFSQNINLENIQSGHYILNVQTKDKKIATSFIKI